MKRTALLSAIALAVALPFAASAATPGENFVTTWDYDGNGKVTLAEVLERRADLFAGFDENEDGVLSAEELAAHDEMRASMQEARPDVAPQAPAGGRFANAGQQRQGRGRGPGAQQQGRGPGMAMRGPQGGRGPGAMQPGWGAQGGAQQQIALDANDDGIITRDEFVNQGKAWFARFDRDGDGEVLPTDFGPASRW